MATLKEDLTDDGSEESILSFDLPHFVDKLQKLFSSVEFDTQNTIHLDSGYTTDIECDLISQEKENVFSFNWSRPFSEIYCNHDCTKVYLIIRNVEAIIKSSIDHRIKRGKTSGYLQLSILLPSVSGLKSNYISFLTHNPEIMGPLTEKIIDLQNCYKIPVEYIQFPKLTGRFTKGVR